MEMHKDIIVGKIEKLENDLDRFVAYKDARPGDVYAWYDIERKEYVIFIAQETDRYKFIEGIAIYDKRDYKRFCPHGVHFYKSTDKTFLDLTGRNPDETLDNIEEFKRSFAWETEVNCPSKLTKEEADERMVSKEQRK